MKIPSTTAAVLACACSLFHLPGCSRTENKPTIQSLADVQAERDRRVSSLDGSEIERCDYGTFAALLEAFSSKDLGVARLESPSGKWNRHFNPCYPDASRSETSRDTYLSVLHLALSRGDMSIPERIRDYAEPKGWVTGEGPTGVTSIAPLAPTILAMIKNRAKAEALPDPLSGFRGHVLATFIWLDARLHGGVNQAEIELLRQLRRETPGSPYLSALRARFDDGDQQEAIGLLGDFSNASRWWGSCPDTVYYAITVAVMEGR